MTPPAVLVLNQLLPKAEKFLKMLKEECARERFLFEYTPAEDFTNCYWQKKKEVLLVWVIYRCAIFVYFLVGFGVIVFYAEHNVPWYKNFIYYTYWSYFSELMAFALAFGATVERFSKQKKNPELPPLEQMPRLYKAVWGIYIIAAPTSVVVTVVFCLFVYTQESFENLFYTLISHVLNSVLMILDFLLSAIPYRFLHFYLPALFSLLYALFTLLYQVCGGVGDNGEVAIYHMLDWRRANVAVATCAVDITCVLLVHCAFCVLNLLKTWIRKTDNDPT